VEIYATQVREWRRTHRSLDRIRLLPVLPVVFHTGPARWLSPGRLVDLVDAGARFERWMPALDPLFLSLRAIGPGKLRSSGGLFGSVLRLLRRRNAPAPEFRRLLAAVMQDLERMPTRDRARWEELVSYVHALVYHLRDWRESSSLQRTIERSVRDDTERRGFAEMGKSYAQYLIEKGEKKGLKKGLKQGERKGERKGGLLARRETLLRLICRRFGDVPPDVAARVDATDRIEQLDDWLDRLVTASSLEELEI
jgi:hypothetical protein